MIQTKSKALIVGGTSGLGFELAKKLSSDFDVVVTGRRDPKDNAVKFYKLDLAVQEANAKNLDLLFEKIGRIDLLVYAAGYFQDGFIDELTDLDIINMSHLGMVVPALLARRVIKNQKSLANFVVITSKSQFTPRENEPVYCAAKAGLKMLTDCFSLDERFGKIVVVAPGGMKTPFWKNEDRDTSTYLDPKWVAEQILENLAATKKYRHVHILRDPVRVVVAEER